MTDDFRFMMVAGHWAFLFFTAGKVLVNREALRASSRSAFVTTLEIAVREGEQTSHWLELLARNPPLLPLPPGVAEQADQACNQ